MTLVRQQTSQQEIILATQIEAVYIENHPDRRASGMFPRDLINWGVRMGLISQQEAEEAK